MDCLQKRYQFLLVARRGRRKNFPGLIVERFDRASTQTVRVGFTATKRLGGAVVRNRAKRRMRAAVYAALSLPPRQGMDLVLVATPKTLTYPFQGLVQDIQNAMQGPLPRPRSTFKPTPS